MTYEEVLNKAREILSPHCLVCKECNGIACRGQVPGVGAKGRGMGFIHSYNYIKSIKVVMNTLYKSQGQDTKINLFGKDFAAPIFVAPIGAMDLNYGGKISEEDYARAALHGAKDSGLAAFTGDGASDIYFEAPMKVYKEVQGWGIPTIKPWSQDKVLEKIKKAEKEGALALAMDIDSAGLVHLAKSGKPVFSKTAEDFREITQATDLPFIVKGIMSADQARELLDTGVYGLVVSNHGGRVLDDTQAPAEVIKEIKEAVGDKLKIFVDGGIRTGLDVFKVLALGADAVLIGRPFVQAAVGGGARGVQLYSEKLIAELKDTMLMTGCNSLEDINLERIVGV